MTATDAFANMKKPRCYRGLRGADNGNRTRTAGLGSRSSATKLYLLCRFIIARPPIAVNTFDLLFCVKLSTVSDIIRRLNMRPLLP